MAYETDKEKIKENILTRLKACKTDMETLQISRAKSLKYYNADYESGDLGKVVEGRSKVVMSDVADVIEWIKPALMKIFYGGESVVDAKPREGQDEKKAELLTEKLNYDFMVALNGFKILYTWFNDALIFKMGVVKWYWVDDFEYTTYTYKNIPEEKYYNLQQDKNFIIDKIENQAESYIDEYGILMPATYTITGRKKTKTSKPMIENVPPEEFGFDMRMKEIDDKNGFVYHKKAVTENELKSYGITEEDIGGEVARFTDDLITVERYKDLGGIGFLRNLTNNKEYWVYECCCYDYDENNTPIPMISTVFGDQIIKTEINKYDRPNYSVLSPILVSHRICGKSYVDIVKDILLARTQLYRLIMDNCAYQNNARQVVNPYRVPWNDVMNGNRPGGHIRTLYDVDPNSCIASIPPMQLPPQVFQMFENAIPEMRMDRTGVTKYNQGLDSKTLNKTATGISQIMSAAQQRIELIARIIAETGMKDLFKNLCKMNVKFFDMPINIKINNEWQLLTPAMIDCNVDIVIDVGIGTGSKEIAFNQKERMLNIYAMIAKQLRDPMLISQIFDFQNLKEILGEMWVDQGYKNGRAKFLSQNTTNLIPTGGQIGGQPNTGGTVAQAGTNPTGNNGGRGTEAFRTPTNQGVFQGNAGGVASPMARMPM